MLLEEVFDIQGVMALAWYSLCAHHHLLKVSHVHTRVPLLIIEGQTGSGKSELARAIAAIDVPEGLKPDAPIHLLPTMTSAVVRRLVNGNAHFVVLESLRDGIPGKSIKAIMRRRKDGPLVMLTSQFCNENSMIADDSIFIRLPKRQFSVQARTLLDRLHREMRSAWQLKEHIRWEPYDSLRDRITEWRERLKQELNKTDLATDAVRSQQLTDYYALILGHWQMMQFSDRDMLWRLFRYAVRCLSLRLPAKDEVRKTLLELQRRNGKEVALVWSMQDGVQQRIVFADEQLYKGFVCMLRMMESTETERVEVRV